MTKPRAGNIDSFCSKLGQSNLKGLMKIPCEHKSHTKHGPGSTSGYERSRKVTGIKNSFSSMRHMIYSRFCTYNSKIEAMLQADTMHDNNREGSGQPRLTQGQIFELSCFRKENVRFWTSLNSGFQKYYFYFCAMSRIAKNGKFEKKVFTLESRGHAEARAKTHLHQILSLLGFCSLYFGNVQNAEKYFLRKKWTKGVPRTPWLK